MPATSSTQFPVVYPTIIGSVISVALNAVILYYLTGLEKKHCTCTLNKHHDSLKILACINISYPVVATVLIALLKSVLSTKMVSLVWYLLQLVYAAALFAGAVVLWRYIDRLNREDCKCAESDMQNINSFLMLWRWIMVLAYGLGLIGLVLFGLRMLSK